MGPRREQKIIFIVVGIVNTKGYGLAPRVILEDLQEILLGQRMAEVIALHLVAVVGLQEGQLPFRLHPFGHDA